MKEQLQTLRKSKGLTQKEAAEIFEVKLTTYQKYELDVISPPYDTLIRIAKFYKVTTDYLLGLESLPDPFADLNLDKDIENDVMAKFTSLSPEVRAIVLDVIAQLGDIIREQQNANQSKRVTITTGELEDQWKAEQNAKNKDAR